MFAARGGAAPRGLSIEVLLYLGRCWLLSYWLAFASVPQQEASPFLEAWLRGAESAPRLVAGAGLTPRSRLCVEFLYRWPLVGRRSVRSADECVVRLSPPCTRERDNTCGPASRLQYTRSRRSDETFMTTHARNHGPLSCRDHLKRVAAELASFVAKEVLVGPCRNQISRRDACAPDSLVDFHAGWA